MHLVCDPLKSGYFVATDMGARPQVPLYCPDIDQFNKLSECVCDDGCSKCRVQFALGLLILRRMETGGHL